MTPESQSAAEQHHKRAMELAELAVKRGRNPRDHAVAMLYAAAFEHESSVAQLLRDEYELEPSRSIICRSAATLAMDCGKLDEAERLAAMGLAGSAPPEIAAELRDVFFEIQYRRHLNEFEHRLTDDVFHMAIVGPAVVGHAIDPDVLTPRVQAMQSLIIRVQEKLLAREFRGAVRRPAAMAERLPILVEPASNDAFGINFRARIQQHDLPLFIDKGGITDSTMRVLRDVTGAKRSSLKKFCNGDPAYYRYFVSSVRSILPDGKRVKSVSVATRDRVTGVNRISMGQGSRAMASKMALVSKDTSGRFTVTGVLFSATQSPDSPIGRVKVSSEGKSQEFKLAKGITPALLEMYWHARVKIRASREGKSGRLPTLEDIDFADD